MGRTTIEKESRILLTVCVYRGGDNQNNNKHFIGEE